MKKLGLVLSGGGALGITHIGVLKSLLEHGFYPDVVSGTSAGSIVATLYAAGKSPDEMIDFIKEVKITKLFRLSGIPKPAGMIANTYLRERLEEIVGEDSFEALQKKLFVCATNLNKGKAVIFSQGSLFDAVVASCSVPMIFKPIEINGDLYVDGGVTNNLPVQPVRDLCEVVIGVNVVPLIEIDDNKHFSKLAPFIQRMLNINLHNNMKPNIDLCDIYIAPHELTKYNPLNIKKMEELVEIGYNAMNNKLVESL
jgi:NTE family protein